jgi:hypothetical protein
VVQVGCFHGTGCCRRVPGGVGAVCTKYHRLGNLLAQDNCWTAYCRAGPAFGYFSGSELRGGAESRADFVHKLRIAVKELNENGIWLLIILKARMAPEAPVTGLAKENRELARMLSASIRTAQAKGSQRTDDK